jgi:thioredoxin 2
VDCPKCGRRNRMTYEKLDKVFQCGNCQTKISAPAEPVDISTAAAFEAATNHSVLPVLVDFWAPWCPPCKKVAPEIAQVASERAGSWLITKVNTEQLPELANKFRISSIPTLAVFRKGAEAGRQAGAMPAAGIRQFMTRFAS